jgi:hypothetical protein
VWREIIMDTRTLIEARNPRWGGPDRRDISLECKFRELEGLGFMPFTAAANDPTPHGAEIFALAKQGQFGPVAEFGPDQSKPAI